MKLSFLSNQKDHDTRGRQSALERARSQLSQAVNGVLSGGLEALGERLQGTIRRPTPALLAQMGAAAQAHAHRLREVIERDRALVETSPLDPREPSELGISEPSEPEPSTSAFSEPSQAPSGLSEAHGEQTEPERTLAEVDGLTLIGVEPKNEDATPPAITAALADVPFVASAARVAPPAPQQCKEPIRTRTMAQLLARQGHRQRALSIYDFLIAADPSDAELVAEAAALRSE
jgi:hypothetical protein